MKKRVKNQIEPWLKWEDRVMEVEVEVGGDRAD